MNKQTMIVMMILAIGLLVVSGCATDATGNVARGAPMAVQSGGGCGIAAPADIADVPSSIDANTAL